jgi:membrane dipeptidase
MIPVFDGHNDTLTHLFRPERGGGRSFFTQSDRGHIDLPRAQVGGT